MILISASEYETLVKAASEIQSKELQISTDTRDKKNYTPKDRNTNAHKKKTKTASRRNSKQNLGKWVSWN